MGIVNKIKEKIVEHDQQANNVEMKQEYLASEDPELRDDVPSNVRASHDASSASQAYKNQAESDRLTAARSAAVETSVTPEVTSGAGLP
ncbi:hypothetical protein [Phaffia rhodozyma]|uniref:Uncharacterized protein n=1 Tax=Phaffia rhodozyma TaxID=264483 RepID=A0A0F7SMH6_PHARH|nr:hypothetical protein [Phaffia rhodozyma]